MKRATSSAANGVARGRSALRVASLLLYGLFAVVFIAGYAARYVHPKYAWFLQLAGIVLPFSALAVTAATFPIFVKRRKILWRIQLIVLVLVVIRFPPWTLYSVSRDPSPNDLRILTYNSPGDATEPGLRVSDAIAALVDETDPHVVSFQEAWWRYATGRKVATGRDDVELLIGNAGFDDAPDSYVDRTYTHQPVLSRIGMVALNRERFQYSPDALDDLEIVHAEIRWQDRSFTLYNVHLASYGTQKPWDEEPSGRLNPRVWVGYLRRYRSAIIRRAWEAERVREIIDRADGPLLLTGDFNATPHNWSYRRITAGLQDAMADAGKGPGFTYHRRRPIARIDFIFASPEFEFTSARTLNGKVSDHLAVTASLRWRDRDIRRSD